MGASMQQKMLDHQYSHQKEMIQAECARNITMATNQFQQQRDQSILALDQQQKQQEMELNMAKQQRLMAISQQAASMQAQATQYKLQMEMQQRWPRSTAVRARRARRPRRARRARRAR